MRIPIRSTDTARGTDRRGFTLVELMITLTVLAVVMVVLMTVMYAAQRSKTSTQNRIESSQAARAAIDMIARDLRSAGYGADLDYVAQPQPPIAYIDSTEVLLNANFLPYPDTSAAAKPPHAYDPGGNPKPRPLTGTAYQPPIKYRRGAELVRWTLDVNNDGAINASDVGDPMGSDAAHTPNPNDYVLVRQTYGDSADGVTAGNNGGTAERIALVRKPATSGVPPLFNVYLQGSSTPWNWALGPIPQSRLTDIERIEVRVVATAARPDARGQYADASLRTEVNSMRNVPSFGNKTYVIDGYAYLDLNSNGVKDGVSEVGVGNATMRLGTGMTTVTNVLGYYQFRVPAGTYPLRELPPSGYLVTQSPDSFVVTVPNAQTRSFANRLQPGGWVTGTVWEDKDGDQTMETGEPMLEGIKLSMGSSSAFTDNLGKARLFASVGSYSMAVTPPDSFVATTPNPQTGTIMDGDSAAFTFGLRKGATGIIKGKVFRDNNRNGALDGSEVGIDSVWVGITPDGGVTVVGYQYTDASGDYSITVPANDPPGDRPYYSTVIVPNGFFPTGSTSSAALLVSASETITGVNFGMVGFQIITLNASRVLSLGATDLIEKDWNGNQTGNAHKDQDLVLGADAGGIDNISIWHNKYNSTPLFNTTRDHGRVAAQSVLALSLDTLDSSAPKLRRDLVTGTRNAAAGNFFVWYTQNSSGNEGIPPTTQNLAYRTSDLGDVTQVLTADLTGGSTADQLDILVGTKSPTTGYGTFEIWTSNNAATPTYTRAETYPNLGSIPSNRLGEVTAMALADFDNDGKRDLVVGTKTGTYSGQLMFFKNQGKTGGSSRFVHQLTQTFTSGAVTSLCVTDVNGDTPTAKQDVVVGLQTNLGSAVIQCWRNTTLAGIWSFTLDREHAAPGLVTALAAADMGGTLTRNDIVMGFRENETSYVGGVRIYFTDLGFLPSFSTDPSDGGVVNFVPALASANFNYGVKPSEPAAPFLDDFAAGVKIDATTGALMVFIR